MKNLIIAITLFIFSLNSVQLFSQDNVKDKNYNSNRKELVDEVYKKDSKIKILNIYVDNNLHSSSLFDEMGNLTEYTNAGKNGTVTKYKYVNNLVSIAATALDGKSVSEIYYKYNEKNYLIEKVTNDIKENNTETQTLLYDSNNKLLEDKTVLKNGTEGFKFNFSYNDSGLIVKELKYYQGKPQYAKYNSYDDSGRLMQILVKYDENTKNFSEKYEYKYDEFGVLISLTSFHSDGTTSYVENYVYDVNKRLSESNFVSDVLSAKDTYKYDSAGNLIEIAYFENNAPDGKKLIEYNSDGNVTRYRIYDKTGKLSLDRKRDYDAKGNLKSDFIDYKAEKKSTKYKYEITYYN